MKREGSKSHLKSKIPTMKFVCPKMKWEYNPADKSMGFISCAKKYLVSTFHTKNPALQDSILVFNQDCELVSQLPI